VKFESIVYMLLGGLDMGSEFFRRHRAYLYSLRSARRYHFRKGGAPEKGASIWFDRVAKPQIDADRELAIKTPIPSHDDILRDALDGRR
jgi:hypothetical protein